jgi:hypothetical protein
VVTCLGEERHLPGIAVGVVQGEDLVYAEGFADAAIESKRTQGPGLVQPIGRQAWIDNLRVAVIVGVIAAHVSTAYILDID